MFDYDIIASSSSGNCVRIKDVLVDCGISFKRIVKNVDLNKISALLITHEHSDHLKLSTIKSIIETNRRIKIFCNEDVSKILEINGVTHSIIRLNTEVTIRQKSGENIIISPLKLYHDVLTYGYRITFKDFFDQVKVFYATDTFTLREIVAKDYDYYFVETNYTEESIDSFDEHRIRNTHLSKEEAQNFFVAMKKDSSVMIPLHRSSRNY